MTPREAALQGTDEIALAVLATTLSLIAVFLPVAFMGGIVGRFMNSFGITMAFAIAVSLLVSFTLTPMMSSRWLRQGRRRVGIARGEQRARPLCPSSSAAIWGCSTGPWPTAGWSYWPCLVFLSTVPLFMVVDKNFLPTTTSRSSR